MTDLSARPDVAMVLKQLKDFQRATAEYAFERLYGNEDPTHRFLVADEVGLGKTMVAKGVISLAVDRLWDSTSRIDVIYICSNAAIARQNINRLNISGMDGSSIASRITMLPVELKNLNQRKLNFVSFTPATSFDLRSNLGMMAERAVLHRMLELAWGVKGAAPKNALQGAAGVTPFRNLLEQYRLSDIDQGIAERFAAALEERVREDGLAGRIDLRARWDELCGTYNRVAKRSNRPVSEKAMQVKVIGDLRELLATTCLKALEPDLIILDEFQRFKHLLGDDTEDSRLARDLFNYSDHESRARVLLLSATPYKMFTQADEADGDDHYEDFLATIRFLQHDPARTERCRRVLEDFRRQLLRLDSAIGPSIRSLKDQLEQELCRVMVRTERLAITRDRDGMLHHVPTPALNVTQEEASTYRSLAKIARLLDQTDPVEYWKSSPYLLSFMEGYLLKQQLKGIDGDHAKAGEIGALVRDCPQLAFPYADYLAYRRLDPGNARMRWLLDRFVESGAWRLLWLPPSRPWYRLEGPFADPTLATLTKLLIFSTWNVVPKSIAALTSYAAEREMMLSGGETPDNTPEARDVSPLLRFGRDSGASLLALIYPSSALCRLGAETEREVGAAIPSRDEMLSALEDRIRLSLQPLPDAPEGRDDEAWYWAAPALLDSLEDEAVTLAWLENPEIRRRGAETSDEVEEGAGVFVGQHVPALREIVVGRGASLGRRPADLCYVLAQLALAGPAVAALRALTNLSDHRLARADEGVREAAGQVGYAFRSYFNLLEVTALIRGAEPDIPYWRQVLTYCVDGGLGAVLEEYAHVLREWLGVIGDPEDETALAVAGAMIEALTIRTANPGVDEVISAPGGIGLTIKPQRMRSRFAARLGEDTFDGVTARTRTDQVRNAFNSPFWPFVLATTSVGQEGLDFHLYCHAVAHWNLPSNPVDLEQREGRVHRYKGHAIRRNVAARHGAAAHVAFGFDPWQAMFDSAVMDRPQGANDLWPYWIYPLEGGASIERHVPMLPLSREMGRFGRLRRSVTLYRLVFGQPRQEDLLDFLRTHLSDEEALVQVEELRLDLSPKLRTLGHL